MATCILHGYFGEKGRIDVGYLRQYEGRVNNFMVLYAWSICCAIDPSNLKNWDERISRPLSKLLGQGYLKTAFNDTKASYIADIMGGTEEGAVQEEEPEEGQDASPGDSKLEEGGLEADTQAPGEDGVGGKRKRKPNKRYMSSPAANKTKSRKGKKRRKTGRITQLIDSDVGFGEMLKLLAIDELKRMALDHVEQARKRQETVP